MLGIDLLGLRRSFQKGLYHAGARPPARDDPRDGPTGRADVSLYTGLKHPQHRDTNISTAEDPVEIMLPAINQVNSNTKGGPGPFAGALRAFLRQDPDVIMVGEIRDLETAEIALKARADRPPRASTLAHQRRAEDPHPPRGHGRQAVRHRHLGEPDHRSALARACATTARRSSASRRKPCDKEGFTDEEIANGIQIYGPWVAAQCTDGYKGRTGIYEVMALSEEMGG